MAGRFGQGRRVVYCLSLVERPCPEMGVFFEFQKLLQMNLTGAYRSSRKRGVRPEAEAKYGKAVELYGTTRLSCREISSICGVTSSGLRCHICKYHRDLMLTRYGISCDREQAANIRLGQLRGQLPATRIKYRDAIEACGSMEFIEFNVSQVARMFGLDGTGLARQLRTHCPEIIELREQTRLRLGLNDNLPRGMRKRCHERYARAVERLRGDSYVSMQEAALILRSFLFRAVAAPPFLSQGFAADAQRFARACQDTEKKRSRHGQRTPPRADARKPRTLPGCRAALPEYGHDD